MLPNMNDPKFRRDLEDLRNKKLYTKAEVDALIKATVRTFDEKMAAMERRLRVSASVPMAYGAALGYEIAWTQATAVQGTWYAVSDADFVDGALFRVNHDGSGKLTLVDGGTYLLVTDISVEGSIANKHAQVGFGITPPGGTVGIVTGAANHVEFLFANEENAVGINATARIPASSAIMVYVRCPDAGTPNLTVDHCMLSAVRIG
jgi:hypothetical protein